MEDKKKMAGKEAVTYVFAIGDSEMVVVPKFRIQLWQIAPSFFASLACIPFGLALGWPAPSYPILLNPTADIHISIDQSAMVAGFLMIGNTLGSPFSTSNLLPAKYGILVGVAFMVSGWVVMWNTFNIYGLLGSRLLVGLGHGYVVGQVKTYIKEMTDVDLRVTLTKQLNLHMFFALIIVYSYGGFVTFKQISIISFAISVVIFCLLLFLPATPKDLVKASKNDEAIKLLARIKPQTNPSEEIKMLTESIMNVPKQNGLWDLLKIIFKDSGFRAHFMLFLVLVFCQQGSGLPATIIYTQILFRKSHVPHTEFIAIGYVIIYFISNVIGIFISPKFNKRNMLMFSSLTVSLALVLQILVINYQLNETLWSYTSVVVMYLFLILHTIGLGNIPLTLVNDFFPLEYRNAVVIFFVMLHSMLALIITKIFQTLMTVYLFDTPFYLFLSFSLIAFVVVYCFFVPEKTDDVKKVQIFTKV